MGVAPRGALARPQRCACRGVAKRQVADEPWTLRMGRGSCRTFRGTLTDLSRPLTTPDTPWLCK